MKKVVLGGFACIVATLGADNWPQYRGPGGLGVGPEDVTLPAQFGPGKAQLWKTDLPLGHGSPCIWDDRIFVTAFEKASQKLEVIALNRKDGKIVWRRTIPAKEVEEIHEVSSPATSTPVTDGKKIYVYSGSYGVLAYEWDGKLAWDNPMGTAKSPFGSGTSPVLVRDLVLVSRDYQPDAFLAAIDKNDGKLVWKANLTAPTQPGSGAAHSTPVFWRDQIILHRPFELSAYDPKDGRKLWWLETQSRGTSTPSPGDGVLYVNAFSIGTDPSGFVNLLPFSQALEKYDTNKDGKLSDAELPANDLFFVKRPGVPDNIPGAHFSIKMFFGSLDRNGDGFLDESEYNLATTYSTMIAASRVPVGLLSVRPSGQGQLQGTAIEWSEKRSVPEITAPLAYRGRVYMVTSGGIVTCLDAKTGKAIFRGRVNAPGPYFASPVAAGGKVFVASGDGIVTVLGGGETLEILANNDLGEPVFGTPALVGSTIYIRSSQHLWAFGRD